MTKRPPNLMIMDACVLIDFVKADRSVLKLISKHIGPVYVASTVLDEVNEIDNQDDLVKLGLIVLEPELEDLFEATSVLGPTSFQDRICMLTAKRHELTCVTNDKNLRRLCEQEGIDIYWGLQLLAELHNAGGITFEGAKEIAQAIHEKNHKHISEEILAKFIEIIDGQEK